MPDGPLVALIVFAVAALAGAIYLFVEHRRHHAPHERARRVGVERIPLFSTDQLAGGSSTDLASADAAERRARTRPRPASTDERARARTDAGSGGASAIGASAIGPDATLPVTPPASPGDTAEHLPARPAPSAASLTPATPVGANAGLAGRVPPPRTAPPRLDPIQAGAPDVVEGETIRFAIPGDHTLQFLPGRLEVVAGPDSGREVRFVRTSGEPLPEVTFGRSEGPAYRHVQILARTVSRLHARMSLLDEHWQLTNLSSTNPVVLNGRPLAQDEVAPLLVDGDRIEMGEVIFLFHSR